MSSTAQSPLISTGAVRQGEAIGRGSFRKSPAGAKIIWLMKLSRVV